MSITGDINPPAPHPCASCPYRRDVPSGLWDATEYAKLPDYDRPTHDQPMGLFQCHQNDAGDLAARVCAGWVACHGPDLMGLRIAVALDRLPASVMEYSTTVPLHPTGAAAAAHGMTDYENPGPAAQAAIRKVTKRRAL